jgi:hypothetical protein
MHLYIEHLKVSFKSVQYVANTIDHSGDMQLAITAASAQLLCIAAAAPPQRHCQLKRGHTQQPQHLK